MDGDKTRKIIVAICGASGGIYGLRLLTALLELPIEVHLIITNAGRAVLSTENDLPDGSIQAYLKAREMTFHERAQLIETAPENFYAPPASGSFQHSGMAVVPCSMNTLAAVSAGITDNLVHRAADVCLKEKRPLVLATRETPLSRIHIGNMDRAAAAGATIMPLTPGFYFRPKTIEDLVDGLVDRVLHHLGIDRPGARQWGVDSIA